jgi:hypothetical protein
MMEMRGGAEEALLAHLALESARRKVGVRLTAVRAVGPRKSDVVLHATPRRGQGRCLYRGPLKPCGIVERLPCFDKSRPMSSNYRR